MPTRQSQTKSTHLSSLLHCALCVLFLLNWLIVIVNWLIPLKDQNLDHWLSTSFLTNHPFLLQGCTRTQDLCIWGKNSNHPDTYGAFCKIVRIFELIKWLFWLFFINVYHIFWSRSLHVPLWCPPLFLFKKVPSRVFFQVHSSSHVYMSLLCVFSHSLLLSLQLMLTQSCIYLFMSLMPIFPVDHVYWQHVSPVYYMVPSASATVWENSKYFENQCIVEHILLSFLVYRRLRSICISMNVRGHRKQTAAKGLEIISTHCLCTHSIQPLCS